MSFALSPGRFSGTYGGGASAITTSAGVAPGTWVGASVTTGAGVGATTAGDGACGAEGAGRGGGAGSCAEAGEACAAKAMPAASATNDETNRRQPDLSDMKKYSVSVKER